MDYIQNELLRQSRAFAALLDSDAGTEKTDKARENRAADLRSPETGEAAALAVQLRSRSESNTRAAALALGLLPNDTVLSWDGAAADRMSGAAETRGAGAAFPDMQAGWGVIPVSLMQNREMDARELSRTIERDARRYGGAYPLY